MNTTPCLSFERTQQRLSKQLYRHRTVIKHENTIATI